MSGSDDLPTDLAFLSSSDHSERLISGRIAPDDLPDDSARVARLLTALRSPTASDGAGEQEAVAAIVAAIAAAPISLETARRRRMLPQLLTAKAAAAAAVVLLAGTGAAAATGSLPDVAQRHVADALAKVDVSIPKPGGDHARSGSHDGEQPGDHGAAVGPDATGPAMKGLCTAWAARSKGDDNRGNSGYSIAFTNLRHRAHDAGMLVKGYCNDVLSADPGSDAADHSSRPADAGTAGADHGRPDAGTPADGTHGKSGAEHGAQNGEHPTPPGTTPESGIDTGSTASDGANSGGVDHAAPPAAVGSDNSAADHGAPTSPSSLVHP